jgi:cytochrome c2
VRLIAATLGLGAAFALAGCGSGSVAGKGDVTHGKELFLKNGSKPACASCHALADAGSTAKVGPNLDTAFAFARVAANKGDRFCDNTIENVVLDQIQFPSKNNLEPQYVMPANLVKGQDAVDVAAYVGSVAGLKPGAKAKQASACS